MSRMTPIRAVLTLAVLIVGASCQAAAPEADADKIGPVTFTCDDGSEIQATFDNAPSPATMLLVRGDQQAKLEQAMSGSGARYVGADVSFWNKVRDAAVEWHGRCRRAQALAVALISIS